MGGTESGNLSENSWSNWSGSLRFQASQIARPESEEDLVALVRRARERGRRLRPVGSSHSSTPIFKTDDILVSMDKMSGVIQTNTDRNEAVVAPGTVLKEMNDVLHEAGLSPVNLGDVALQTIGGAIGTGTHGTGRRLGNLSTMLAGGRIVTGSGEVLSFNAEDDPETLRAMRVSLGALGIFSQMQLKLLPAYALRRMEFCTTLDACMENLEELVERNRNFDFYWYPRSDEVKLRVLNEPGRGMTSIPFARCVEDNTGRAAEMLHKHTDMTNRFEEMEYEVPFEAGRECFLEVRERFRKKWRRIVGWRVLYRTIAADDSFLSPANGRDSVSISVHQNAGLPWEEFFRDIEPVMRDFAGRPHWAKKHTLGAKELKPLYPEWDRFQAVRRKLDPEGVFVSPYLRRIFGI